ncbi:MAG: PLD nuclease N-terminal domain-containing protein [Arcicella sp.]|nr:PLD nuclease N-terminal domain-containing protein [Arcicella sp.]
MEKTNIIQSGGATDWHILRIELILAVMIIVAFVAIIDIARSRFNGYKHVSWLIISIFVPMGGVLYFIFGRKQKATV